VVTHAVLKTIAAFLNTEGGNLLIGVADDGSVLGIEHDQLESDDKFMRHLVQCVQNGLGDRAGTCIDPKVQLVREKTVCLVSCQRSPEPVFLRWKGKEAAPEGDFYVRSTAERQAQRRERARVHPDAVPRRRTRHRVSSARLRLRRE
jgi:predicted HTH transcriptional regulator